jgi:hypothetical protein
LDAVIIGEKNLRLHHIKEIRGDFAFWLGWGVPAEVYHPLSALSKILNQCRVRQSKYHLEKESIMLLEK